MQPSNLACAEASLWTTRDTGIAGTRLRVLVVDDNQNAAHALAAGLALADMECCTACGGREAIAIGIAWEPHLVLMDLSPPEYSGAGAARFLRHDPAIRDVAIIAHSALDEAELRRLMTDDDFDAYLQKGQPRAQMVALIRRLAH
ncbi:response regulator [Paraburkholderia sediminicola]|jgi:Response regulators consisting of a CheY-like receiver domain and a winged-helix DNA-binding domain|nr:response regulator [Paraburkholderia sediminicola]